MKRAIRFIPIILVAITALGSCSLLGRIFAKSFDVQLQSDASDSAAMLGSRSLAAGYSVSLNMGIDGSQSGALVGGSSAVQDITMGFVLDTILPDGSTAGGFRGNSEIFVAPDPSIIDLSIPSGTTLDPVSGFFMARFTGDRDVVLVATEGDWPAQRLDEIDEVVLRLANDENALMETSNGQTYYDALRFDPHLVVTAPDGSTETYPSHTNSVTINGQPTEFTFDYVLFAPASVIGAGFSYYVPRGRTVSSPVIGNPLYGDTDPSQWSPNPDWITDDFGNAGLFAAIDAIAGVSDPADRRSSDHWMAIAAYFQEYFTKYYAAMSTMFNIPNEETGVGGLGNGGDSGFVLIALDDTAGALTLTRDAVITVQYRPNPADFTIAGDTIDLTGTPPLDFRAVVVR